MDTTENIRREMVAAINSQVESDDKLTERQRLEAQYGQVWDTEQATTDFEFIGFSAPYVVVQRRADGKKGSLMFQHSPRFYFQFRDA
jgi:hypothetical protein